MKIDTAGWLCDAEKVPSPNFDARSANATIKLIVVHGISLPPGEFGGGYIQQLFCNRLNVGIHEYFSDIAHMRVSAHCLIERSGHVVQFVSFLDRAWHAGVSSWRGEEACNDFSIGIELEGTDLHAYTPDQYRQLSLLVKALRTRFPAIEADAICGHNDIAPGRKTDPGPSFNWVHLRGLLEV